MITSEWSDWRNGLFWWIQSVYVDSAHRDKGVFSLLYKNAKTRAKAECACGIRLYVEKDNQQAQNIYLHLGMKKTDYDEFVKNLVS